MELTAGLIVGVIALAIFAFVHGLKGGVPTITFYDVTIPFDVIIGSSLIFVGTLLKRHGVIVVGVFLLSYFFSGYGALLGQGVRQGNPTQTKWRRLITELRRAVSKKGRVVT